MLRRLWGHLGTRRRRQFAVLAALTVLASFAEVISISAILPFLGALIAPERVMTAPKLQRLLALLDVKTPADALRVITGLFVAAVLIAGMIRLALLWVTTRVTFSIGEDLSSSMYRRVLFQPYSYIANNNTSDLIGAISIKANAVVYNTILPSLNMVSSTIVAITVMGALVFIDPIVATTTLVAFGLIYGAVVSISRLRLSVDSREISSGTTRLVKVLQEGFGGIRDILVDGTQDTYCRIFKHSAAKLRRAQGNSVIISQGPRFVVEALGTVMIAALAYVVASRGAGVTRLFPVLGALALGAQRLLPAVQQIYSGWASIESTKASLADVLNILDLPIEPAATDTAAGMLQFRSGIVFKDVSFRYAESGPWILRNVNLTIRRGSRLGIIGSTGSGKSTLTDLLMGLLSPTEGVIEVDGTPIDRGNIRGWQAHLAHVPQTIFLADSSIAENIAFGIPVEQIDIDRVKTAAEKAQIADVISRLPAGLATVIGERGARMSGGQRQRIGIARALYKAATLIVFDEATSALDGETEASVISSIEALGGDVTTITIAHRLSTLKGCTEVLEVRNGAVAPISMMEKFRA